MSATVTISERELQDAVVETARLFAFRAFHARPAQTSKGWRTPVQYDGKGFVDLVLVGSDRILFVELKSDKGKVSVEQQQWLDGLGAVAAVCDQVEVHVWTPQDWPAAITATLSGRQVVVVS